MKEWSTFADGSDCSECKSLEKDLKKAMIDNKTLTQQLAAANEKLLTFEGMTFSENQTIVSLRAELQTERQASKGLVEALNNFMTDFSLDWYISIMGKSEKPEGFSSGIVGKIHNAELTNRMHGRIYEARAALDSYNKTKGEKS